ncbi:hypothetical protein PLESTB_000810200 [Pleodorina starrii]|uniref:ACT domain-containing protein n=1 Tax=Pleodorina starrii TaxID=330485 RepID=A0A9W6BKQ3_9CHLO|nr:hypothetical protein PLESTM_000914600 [Pleodorina starrii]GLC53972.1 hypothetical protein PLESTB_000810200 [Pleodorina starrii]GLC70255.1 hypothetical protein PLESTF_000948800 [Pleodorina starrii]
MAHSLASRSTLRSCITASVDACPNMRPMSLAIRGVPVNRAVRLSNACATGASRKVMVCRASGGATITGPMPTVKIDNVRDPFATILTVEYGEKTGELLDAITALKNLGLNIRRAKVNTAGTTFYITDADTSEKIVKSARLEDIRMTVLNSLVAKFPEVGEALSVGAKSTDADSNKVLGTRRRVVQTTIEVVEASNGSCSVLKISTSDRPGLLVDIVRVLKDINLNVVSAEIDTEGTQAKDEFFITYHGEPLTSPMVTLVTNALQYYLSLAEVAKEESY